MEVMSSLTLLESVTYASYRNYQRSRFAREGLCEAAMINADRIKNEMPNFRYPPFLSAKLKILRNLGSVDVEGCLKFMVQAEYPILALSALECVEHFKLDIVASNIKSIPLQSSNSCVQFFSFFSLWKMGFSSKIPARISAAQLCDCVRPERAVFVAFEIRDLFPQLFREVFHELSRFEFSLELFKLELQTRYNRECESWESKLNDLLLPKEVQ
jgi:hypothetical protein